MILKVKVGEMELMQRAGLVLALILTTSAAEIADQSARYPDYAQHPEGGVWASRRVWDAAESVEDAEGKALVVQSSYGIIPGGDLRGGGWSAVAPPLLGGAYDEEGAVPWDVVASESETRGVYSGERMRWMPTKSRYRPRKEPVQDESPEMPLQEHQRRQRLQLQQQLLKRAPEGRRGALQLENLGGGMLEDDDDDEEEPEEEVEDEEDVRQPGRIRSRIASPPQPFSKLPAFRPPVGVNEPTPGKAPSAADLKSILKMSGPLSLSEILQRKNLSLEELLRGSRLAISAVAQSATTESSEVGTRTEQRRRRPKPTGSRPQLKRRRTTTPPDFVPDLPPTTSTQSYTTTTQTTTPRTSTTQRPTTTSAITTTTEEPRRRVTTVEEPEITTIRPQMELQSQNYPRFTSSGDPARDILDIILQEDENDGPSLAEVLSSRNMTVADLIEQRERASGRSTITSLFPPPSSIIKEWQRRKGRGEERMEETTSKNMREEDGRRGRKFARFDLTETDWEDPSAEKMDATPVENEEEEIDDQQVTQTRNNYQVISSQEAVVHLPKPSEPYTLKTPLSDESIAIHPPIPAQPKISQHIPESETKITQTYIPTIHEIPTFREEGHRPIIRTRVTAPTTTTEEISSNEVTAQRDSAIHNTQRAVHEEYEHEARVKTNGLPEGVKSAIIASTSLLGIALFIFLAIFAVFRYRQWRRRRGMGPYLCAAVLEAAAGSRKSKGPKIIKKGKTKERGWGDTFDSAQERLWRTLRRGRCRFYDRENGQM